MKYSCRTHECAIKGLETTSPRCPRCGFFNNALIYEPPEAPTPDHVQGCKDIDKRSEKIIGECATLCACVVMVVITIMASYVMGGLVNWLMR